MLLEDLCLPTLYLLAPHIPCNGWSQLLCLPCLSASEELDRMANARFQYAEIDPGTSVFPQTCSPSSNAPLTGKVAQSPCPHKQSPEDLGLVVNGAPQYDTGCCPASVSLQRSSAFMHFPQLLLTLCGKTPSQHKARYQMQLHRCFPKIAT